MNEAQAQNLEGWLAKAQEILDGIIQSVRDEIAKARKCSCKCQESRDFLMGK